MEDRTGKGAWLWVALLTFSAGFTNTVATLGTGLAVSHHTGNLTQLALALLEGQTTLIASLAGLILFFFLGSILAGIFFYQKPIGQARAYGLFSLVQGSITILASFILSSSWILLLYFFTALGMGLQNGILKNVRQVTTRTSHMTGYLTDAGVALGHIIRGDRGQAWTFWYFTCHLILFFLGTLTGGLTQVLASRWALGAAGLIQLSAGISYMIWISKRQNS
mgnify:CR=1 FL=1